MSLRTLRARYTLGGSLALAMLIAAVLCWPSSSTPSHAAAPQRSCASITQSSVRTFDGKVYNAGSTPGSDLPNNAFLDSARSVCTLTWWSPKDAGWNIETTYATDASDTPRVWETPYLTRGNTTTITGELICLAPTGATVAEANALFNTTAIRGYAQDGDITTVTASGTLADGSAVAWTMSCLMRALR